jgi:hypothetical protein
LNRFQVVEDISAVMSGELLMPTVVRWNRLEGRPRAQDFSKALRSEVRDALWMLARQWQTGEFEGDDAGSPVTAKLSYASDPVTHLRSGGGTVRELDDGPLEVLTEHQPIPSSLGTRPVSLDLRLLMGRHWAKLLRAAGLPTLQPLFLTEYPITAPDPEDEADHPVTAHPAVWQTYLAVAGRAVDGMALFEHLVADPGHLASDGLGLTGTDKDTVDTLGGQFVDWFDRLLHRPEDPGDDSWLPHHLEYGVALSAPTPNGPRTLIADEYHGGHLDWYSFDVAGATDTGAPFPPAGAPDPARRVTRSFFPTNAQFDGMPHTRWWTFEEAATSFGDIQPDTTDLNKLLLIEFGLVYANDWFLAPIQLALGTVTQVDGLAVTNVFGERTWIEPSSTAVGETWRSWAMFTITGRDGTTAPNLAMLATTPTILQGAPVEAVHLVRDEVSNLVWGIETVVHLPDGSSRRGHEVAIETHRRHQAVVDEASGGPPSTGPPANDATVRYQLTNRIAENWIPFIAVHVTGDNREIQLQRAAMPRLLEGTAGAIPAKIRPRTRLLRPGADAEVPPPFLVYEEEISRAGEIVTRSWQRTRWGDGRVYTWLGAQRQTGRGEASSGLAFDRLVPKT